MLPAQYIKDYSTKTALILRNMSGIQAKCIREKKFSFTNLDGQIFVAFTSVGGNDVTETLFDLPNFGEFRWSQFNFGILHNGRNARLHTSCRICEGKEIRWLVRAT